MVNNWTSYAVVTAVAVSALSIAVWSLKKKKYIRVGKIGRLFFFPVKSLKAVEVTNGKFTKFGFEVNGVLDRAFMLVDDKGILITQRQYPSLVLLTPQIKDDYLIITGANVEPLEVAIRHSPPPDAKIINCTVHTDSVAGVDCGEEAALWFQKYLDRKGVRLVRFFSSITVRKYTSKDPFYTKLRKDHVAGFQDLTACHMLSQASIDDLNSKIGENKVSVLNFRPNILVDDCRSHEEDSWKLIKFPSGALMQNILLTTRCLLTTNDPEKGILSQKEPLVTLRKFRIVADENLSKILGAIPCLGTCCAVLKPGDVKVGDDIFAVVGAKPAMKIK